MNDTKSSYPTLIWCLLMPSIHFLSLISNILCIIVFCSNTFIKKPIAIYFLCLLISDSITLLIGYIEMIDRESHMIDKSSWLCMFNEKIIHTLTDIIYTFMSKFCLEWILYKVLWTRASTIILAILSVQRTRTFLSLSYRETRLCALLSCLFSVIIAMIITCLEWIGVQFGEPDDFDVYYKVFRTFTESNSSEMFYSTYLTEYYNESINSYSCMLQSFHVIEKQDNCTSQQLALQFYNLTISIISNGNISAIDDITNFITNYTAFYEYPTARPSDLIVKLFERRHCHISLPHAFLLKHFDFFHSVSFTLNRRMLAIFFGNALPSFIVALANLISIRVIYCSQTSQYLQQANTKTHRRSRFQNDLRAFLVILIESFSIILISWGVPISLTMFHCHTLYVLNIAACPQIKNYLAFFLCIDLFNSSTNCLLYSLSGKIFRQKLVSILKATITFGRGTLWKVSKAPYDSTSLPLERRLSNNRSTTPSLQRYSTRQTSKLKDTFEQTKRFSEPPACSFRHSLNLPKPKFPIECSNSREPHPNVNHVSSLRIPRRKSQDLYSSLAH